MDYVFYVLIALIGYFLGALPFGYLVAKAHGVDIFKAGSGNPGATNVRRVLGSRAGNMVFALDFLKGSLAAALPLLLAFLTARYVNLPPNLPADEVANFQAEAMSAAKIEALFAVLGAVLGHSFSVFTHFKGGKGVATAAGGLVVLMPIPCLIGIVVWFVTYYTTRYVSLGSLLAAVAVPLAGWLMVFPLPLKLVATLVGLFVIIRHRINIQRLLNGTENRFVKKTGSAGEPASKPPPAPP
jgi:glycerol-3-phosphate acyltransferase PlsY